MDAINFKYNITYKVSDEDKKIIVLTQIAFFKGSETEIEIPVEDIESVISNLIHAKEEVKYLELNQIRNVNKVVLDISIVNTLVSLFLSGIPVEVLSSQYNIDEDVVRENLEDQGIILLEDI